MSRRKNLALMQRVSMDVFEIYGFKCSVDVLDALTDKLSYDYDVFLEYAKEAYEAVVDGYELE
ncbi:hypothetical protein [Vibrio vulnificus]|uniref:hypothetical protein n=1 Tax=Vibrio vulnificus TaxID=672 RepID=UPI003242B0E6